MRLFRWLSAQDIPDHCDLRRCGWQRAALAAALGDRAVPALAELRMIDALRWVRLLSPDAETTRGATVLIGVDRPEERARLLRVGFGDVMPGRPALAELDARMERVAAQMTLLPARRTVGDLELDLVARDGVIRDGLDRARALGLHPREFALLWRLAEPPLRPVGRLRLLQEVWHLNHVPETNSLAVHICRLRSKLARVGCDGLVRTLDDGSYMLVPVTAGSGLRFGGDPLHGGCGQRREARAVA